MRCNHWRRVPPDLAREARQKAPDGCVDRAVQCQLSAHGGEKHYGLLAEVNAYGTALWLRWYGTSTDLTALQDCPVTGPVPDGEGCCLFVGHPEQHTWQDATGSVSAID
ncbi:hypothetical protein ACFWM7_06470 [Streptomyces sp. NPDC058375]|uniref:hypothetical protein n=1 Tax=Streptomyces sp. NPDC058375 TaxID=3346467 RepID=UPI00365E3AD3